MRRYIMKKLTAMMSALIFLSSMMPNQIVSTKSVDLTLVYAAEITESGECGENITWDLDENGTLTLSGNGEMSDYIQKSPFAEMESIKNVIIEDGITSVGNGAFWGCNTIKTISIPDSVTEIGSNAFEDCTSLESVNIPYGVTIINGMTFANCTSLKEITIPDSVETIWYGAFYKCTSLTEVELPLSITTLSYGVFQDCTNLENIIIPDTVTEIGSGILSGCKEGVTITGFEGSYAHNYAIDNNISFTSVTYSYLYYYDGMIAEYKGYSRILDVPTELDGYTMTMIGDSAYRNNRYIMDVNIPEGFDFIGSFAFAGCSNMTDITIPSSITEIGDNVFDGCNKLRITGYENSVAHKYALKNNIPFISIGTMTFDETYEFDAQTGTITGYNGNALDLTIPEDIDGVPVTAVGESVFKNNSHIYSVTLPETLVSIGANAFVNCYHLKSIIIPKSVTEIGQHALGYNSNEYDYWAEGDFVIYGYYGSAAIQYAQDNEFHYVIIDNKEQNIPDYDFDRKTGTIIKYNGYDSVVEIPSEIDGVPVVEIADGAFEKNPGIKTVSIPDGVKRMGSSVFNDCISLKNVSVPDSVIRIGDSVFRNCKSLTSVNIPDGIASISSSLFEFCTSLKSIAIPESVSEIGSFAFYYCTSLEKIIIPKNVVRIDEYAFVDTPWLNNHTDKNPIFIFNGILIDGEKCTGEVVIPEGIKAIQSGVFSYNEEITGVKIPESVTDIESDAFEGCTNLSNVTLPDTLEVIGYNAFTNCTALTEITIPESVVTIEDEAIGFIISYDENGNGEPTKNENFVIKGYDLTEAAAYASKYDFEFVSLGKAPSFSASSGKFGDNITWTLDEDGTLTLSGKGEMNDSVYESPFINNRYIEKIIIEDGITSVSHMAFDGCKNLKSVVLPEGITYISYSAFYNCINLKEINFPDSLNTISDGAFCNCNSLENVVIPENVENIDSSAFWNTKWLDNIIEENEMVIVNNILIDGSKCKGDVVIPDGVKIISEFAFYSNTSITSVKIPDSVKEIEYNSFEGCYNLESVNIPDGITKIKSNTFSRCDSLESITIPESVKIIDFYAFAYCTNLSEVTLPEKIEYIGEGAFLDTKWFEENTMNENLFIVGDILLSGKGCKGDVIIPDNIYYICSDAFSENDQITSITIPDSIISIPDNTFCGCTKLETVNLPKNLTEIYFNAFRNCTSLKSISIPENVREIYQSAFIGCTALESIDLPKNIEYLGIDVFKDTPWLENKKAEKPLVVVNNFVIDGSNCEGKVVIPEGTKYIAEEAFIENEKITEVVLPESLYYIGFNAFTGCSNLKEITIPSNVKDITDESIGFTYKETYEGVDILKNEGLVIKGYDGTAAHKYAARNGFEYVSLGEYESTYVFGDINLDGIIDANDASALLTYYALSSTGYNRVLESFIIENNPEFNYYMFYDAYEYGEFGDINGDEIIDANDASAVLSYYAQSSTDYEGTLEEFMKSMKA